MMIFLKNILIILTIIKLYDSYYIRNRKISKSGRTENEMILPISIVKIENNLTDANSFPSEFSLSYEGIDYKFQLINSESSGQTDIYTNNFENSGQIFKFQHSGYEIVNKLYKSVKNDAIATLILNSDVKTRTKYRALIKIFNFLSGYECEIIPLIQKTDDTSEPNLIGYVAKKYKVSATKDQSEQQQSLNVFHKEKRKAVTNLYVQYLIVADESVLLKHKRILSTDNTALAFLHMKIYYTQIVSAMNMRFVNSMKNSDFIINVRPANFIFLTGPVSWTDPKLVGDPKYPTYDGSPVIVNSLALNQFTNYMNSLTLDFEYDNAVGLFADTLLWDNNYSNSPTDRGGLSGYSWVGSICTSLKTSIVQENGFFTINIASHELGHMLGAAHDGQAGAITCPASDNFIMTPCQGAYNLSLNNTIFFSSCSISSFQKTLFSNDRTRLKSSASCLSNIPTNIINESAYSTNTLPGQLWNLDTQCSFFMGHKSSVSKCYQSDICTEIWCSNNSSCIGVSGWGALDGTSCGSNNKICLQGQCVKPTSSLTQTINQTCSNKPCLNGGTCLDISNFFICFCTNQYYGDTCQYSMTSSNPLVSSTNATLGKVLLTTKFNSFVAENIFNNLTGNQSPKTVKITTTTTKTTLLFSTNLSSRLTKNQTTKTAKKRTTKNKNSSASKLNKKFECAIRVVLLLFVYFLH